MEFCVTEKGDGEQSGTIRHGGFRQFRHPFETEKALTFAPIQE